jgi:hypothetical protein
MTSMVPSSRPCGDAPPRLTDGEQWCRTELARLADGRWRGGPWLEFARAALARARHNRSCRPGLSAQARRWIAVGAGAWLLAGRRQTGPFALARRRGLVWWAACGLILDWHLGMIETEHGEAVMLNGADALTLLRAWLVPAVAPSASPGLLLLGGLTDVADGRVARATRCTRFGRDLEGTVDACFIVAALRGAARSGSLSRLPVRLEQARLAAGVAYASHAYFVRGAAPDRAVPRSARAAAPVRLAGLIAAGLGRRRLADGLLVTSTGIATAALAAAR